MEYMGFSYSYTDEDEGDTLDVNQRLKSEFLTLDEVAAKFAEFLRSAGYTYVTEVAIRTAGDHEFTGAE